MEVMTDATWAACPNLDEFIDISDNPSSPLIFEPCDSSSPSVTSLDTHSEGDEEVFWNRTSFSSMPFLEMDDWLEDFPSDFVTSFSPCTMDSSYSLTSTHDTKLAPSSFVSSAVCTSEAIKPQENDCANLDHSLYNEGLLQDPTSDVKLETGCPASCSSWIGSDRSQSLTIESDFLLKSGENVNEQQDVFNTSQTYPDMSKIIVKKPILDKAVEKLGGGKVGAQMLWQLIRLWLAQRDSPVSERLASLKHVQVPVNFFTSEQFDIHSTPQAMGEKGFEDRIFSPRIEGIPDQDKKHATQWMFQQRCGKVEPSPSNSLLFSCISEKPVSFIQENGKIDHHAAWPPISSQVTVDGANFASYGVGSFSGDASEGAHVIDGSAHPQTRTGLNVKPVPLEPPSLISASVTPGLSCAAQKLNNTIVEQALHFSQYNRVHTEPSNLGGLVNLQLGIDSALQSETSLENFTMDDSTNPGLRTPAATSRAARKSRMARQRRFMTNRYALPSASSVSCSSLLSSGASRKMSMGLKTKSFGRSSCLEGKVKKLEQNLKLLLQKELKPSDVGNLGRIVLPKVIGGKKMMHSDATEITSGEVTPASSASRSYGGSEFNRLKRGNSSTLACNTGNKRSGKNEPLTNPTVTSSPFATPPLTPPSENFDSQEDALLQVAIPKFPDDNIFERHDLPQLECFPKLEAVDISIEDFLDLVEDSKSGFTTTRDQELAEEK